MVKGGWWWLAGLTTDLRMWRPLVTGNGCHNIPTIWRTLKELPMGGSMRKGVGKDCLLGNFFECRCWKK